MICRPSGFSVLTRPVSTPEPHDDTDSAEEDCPVPSVEPPVFPHPEGPVPLPVVASPFGLHWFAKLAVVFLITSLSVLVLFPDVLSALEISIPKTLVGSVLAGASLLNTSNGRRYSLMGILLSAFLFLSFCNFSANAEVLDMLRPGQPATFLHKGFTPYSPSSFGSPALSDFLTTESTAFMVSQGDPSDFNLTWCVDCGANRHESSCPLLSRRLLRIIALLISTSPWLSRILLCRPFASAIVKCTW